MLHDFATWLEGTSQTTVTVTGALAWANLPAEASADARSRRLTMVRGFARYLAAYDPACEVPPLKLLPSRRHRPEPYIYSPREIAALVHAAGTLAAPLRAATMQAVVSLLAVTGLRIGEAVGLDRDDVHLDRGQLTVLGKNSLIRRVPLHPTTVAMLSSYAARRDRHCPTAASSPAFFVTTTGHWINQHAPQSAFGRLVALVGISTPGRRRPRLHDLRHTRAITTQFGRLVPRRPRRAGTPAGALGAAGAREPRTDLSDICKNPQELSQPGEKPQVGRSAGARNGAGRPAGDAA
jgi:integrase